MGTQETARAVEPGAARLDWPRDPVEVLRVLQPRLMTLARTLDRDGAEDLVQDTLIETLIRHPDFTGLTHPLGYTKVTMFRIAYRRRLRVSEESRELQERLELDTEPDPAQWITERLTARRRSALWAVGNGPV